VSKPSGPRFSLIIPTHNRAHLLRHALQSVVSSSFGDFEVVVSDDQSTDDTASAVEAFGSTGQIRRVLTPERMSMADHFEWASHHATGEYVFFLCDDDAISPDLLERVDVVVRDSGTQVCAFRSALYFGAGWRVRELQNTLQAERYTMRALECDCAGALKAMFSRFHNVLTPRCNNAFFSRRLLEDIRRRVGKFFLHPAPDASSSCLVLASTKNYMLLDEPVHAFGNVPESIGADQQHQRSSASEAFRRFVGDMFELSPVDVYCVANVVAESYLRAGRALPGQLPELDQVALYQGCSRDLDLLESNGVDVSSDRHELARFRRELGLLGELELHRRHTRERLAVSPLGSGLRRLKHSIWAPPIPLDHRPGSVTIRGEEEGFTNIAECAARLPSLRPRLAVR
jgi:glycosyltransferase involved in cell wall biosynthesis